MRRLLGKLMTPDPRKCERARARMSDYLDGELEREERRSLERHIRFCPRCRTVLGNLRQTLARLGGLHAADDDDVDAVSDRVASRWREHA